MMKKINFLILFLISVAPMLAHADWMQVGLGKGTSLYLETTKTAPIDSSSKRAVTLLSFESKQQVAKTPFNYRSPHKLMQVVADQYRKHPVT